MADTSLPKYSSGDPRNCLPDSAKQRLTNAYLEAEKIRTAARAALNFRYSTKKNPRETFAEYLSHGRAAIEFNRSLLASARLILSSVLKEYRNAGKSRHELQELMRDEVDAIAYVLEIQASQQELLLQELNLYHSDSAMANTPVKDIASAALADLPVLSDALLRKLDLRRLTLLDEHRLTGEHLKWHERERNRLRMIALQSPPGFTAPNWRSENAVDGTGIGASLAIAKGLFNNLTDEYWQYWLSSGDSYEVFVRWLDDVNQQVSTEVASIWKGGSGFILAWYTRACAPSVQRTLADLVNEQTKRAPGC